VAKKPKLSHRQRRQVAANRNKRLSATQANEGNDSVNTSLGESKPGLVIGRFGKHADVRDDEGLVTRCHIRRTVDSVVCGDRVLFAKDNSDDNKLNGIIELVQDRHSVLTRPDFYDGIKPIAANIDQIIVVSSVIPALSLNIIDRYLVACEDIGIQPILVLNKVELLSDGERETIEASLALYRDLGYTFLFTSCTTGEGIDALHQLLKDKVSVFVGQSGVGKSSIINQVLPEANELVGDVSDNSGLGQHTTTAAKLLPIPSGGDLIDSPGVREFGLWHLPADKVTRGFIEFRDYLGGCKFRDCKHLNDPGCLIRQAVEDGKISKSRYDSYHKILAAMDEQRPAYIKP
jgi:ribosome biogenesis GTPase